MSAPELEDVASDLLLLGSCFFASLLSFSEGLSDFFSSFLDETGVLLKKEGRKV